MVQHHLPAEILKTFFDEVSIVPLHPACVDILEHLTSKQPPVKHIRALLHDQRLRLVRERVATVLRPCREDFLRGVSEVKQNHLRFASDILRSFEQELVRRLQILVGEIVQQFANSAARQVADSTGCVSSLDFSAEPLVSINSVIPRITTTGETLHDLNLVLNLMRDRGEHITNIAVGIDDDVPSADLTDRLSADDIDRNWIIHDLRISLLDFSPLREVADFVRFLWELRLAEIPASLLELVPRIVVRPDHLVVGESVHIVSADVVARVEGIAFLRKSVALRERRIVASLRLLDILSSAECVVEVGCLVTPQTVSADFPTERHLDGGLLVLRKPLPNLLVREFDEPVLLEPMPVVYERLLRAQEVADLDSVFLKSSSALLAEDH